ncbi:MAG: 4-phosphoerythronate dehydrogenase PdxB [Bacteroidales bacterium]|nr:4-phosphoerythronate dehydrogenase PdxB [Bacteroidales bacterium]
MIRIVADQNIPFLRGVLEPFAEIRYLPANAITHSVVSHADALLIRTRTLCDKEILRDTPVRFIGTATIGYDHIDTRYCDDHGISWNNAPGCNAASVQQYLASALFTLSRREGFHLKNKTIGIVGVGHVGSKVEQLARILGMNILLNDPPRERAEGKGDFVSLPQLLQESDIVTLHVPLLFNGMDKTFHLIGRDQFRQMKPTAWLINASRGEVVDQAPLTEYLRNKKLAGGILDVWENEPHIDPGLMSVISIATPHIAGYSADGKATGTAMVVRALVHYFGLPLKDWFPTDIPLPVETLINIDGNGKTAEEIAGEAVLKTYNILEDDSRLRADPEGFEQQRSAYPLRREFPAFQARITGSSVNTGDILKKMGFRILFNFTHISI